MDSLYVAAGEKRSILNETNNPVSMLVIASYLERSDLRLPSCSARSMMLLGPPTCLSVVLTSTSYPHSRHLIFPLLSIPASRVVCCITRAPTVGANVELVGVMVYTLALTGSCGALQASFRSRVRTPSESNRHPVCTVLRRAAS